MTRAGARLFFVTVGVFAFAAFAPLAGQAPLDLSNDFNADARVAGA